MGGDSFLSSPPSSEDASLSGQNLTHESINSSRDEDLSHELENALVIDGMKDSNSGKFPDVCPRFSAIDEAVERQRMKVFSEVLRSYKELQSRIDRLEEARNKILSYTPGSWADIAGGMDLKEYDVPNATSLLLIGPKGSGKSSLVNKISRVLEDDVLLSGRAQVSHNSSAGDGTYFLHQYMVPRVSGSFCLYDTRGLSADSSENQTMLNRWMKKGVRHGELIRRKSDSMSLKAQLKCKARRSSSASQRRAVDFAIFVVNGLSVLESMDSADEKKKRYSQMIATNFIDPLLSFKDDKPVVVVTHGDLLPLSDRVRVRVYLGDILGIPPTRQIFDIPENNDSSTALAIFDMLTYSLERADRNLPTKRDLYVDKVYAVLNLLFWIVMAVVIIFGFPRLHIRQPQATTTPSPPVHIHQPQATTTPPPPIEVDWAKMRHLWLEE